MKYAVKVKRSATGLGLYAGEDMPRRRFVVEYFGTIISDDEADNHGGKYLFTLDNGTNIEGSSRTNIARYINHSCKPNCEVETTSKRVYIYTKRAIKAGEELTYDYGKEYYNHFIRPHGCRCGANTKRHLPLKKKNG